MPTIGQLELQPGNTHVFIKRRCLAWVKTSTFVLEHPSHRDKAKRKAQAQKMRKQHVHALKKQYRREG